MQERWNHSEAVAHPWLTSLREPYHGALVGGNRDRNEITGEPEVGTKVGSGVRLFLCLLKMES